METSVQLTVRRGSTREVMAWSGPALRFTSEDLRQPPSPPVVEAWDPAEIPASVREEMRRIPAGGTVEDEEWRVDLRAVRADATVVQFAWGLDGEDDPRRKVRQDLQRLGHLRFRSASKALAAGTAARREGRFGPAAELFERGIRILGDLYVDPRALDSTGQKVVAAADARHRGEFEVVAALLQGVLDARLQAYQRQFVPPGEGPSGR